MTATPAFELRCRELGYEIFERARAAEPRIWQQAWWQQFGTRLIMRHERLKVQLFRFIDVLPVLRDDRELARHLAEYLDPERLDIPAAMRLLVSYHDPGSWHARTVASLTRWAARMMARSFIAASNTGEAIACVERFRRRKMAFTLDVLGEYTSSEDQADKYEKTYLDLMESLCPAARRWPTVPVIDQCSTGPMPRVNISIKLSALSPRFDPIDPERAIHSVCGRLRRILRRARELGAFINIDMESFAYRDLTIELFTRLLSEDEFRDMTDVGIVIQAYLRDGENDFDRLLEWVKRRGFGIAIRLVKGAYWDSETVMAAQNNSPPPVWLCKWESDASFERIARRMLQNHRLIRPAFASHNVRSLAAVMAAAEQLGLTTADYEMQMLNGMGDPLKQAMVDLGRCLRVYTPYGELVAGMGYLIRRLLENTANDSFLRQSFNVRDVTPLLSAPRKTGEPTSTTGVVPLVHTGEDDAMNGFRNEPNTSFANAENRAKYRAGLVQVRSQLGREYPLVINGKAVQSGEWTISSNPANPSEVIGRVATATTADADDAVAAARNALRQWRRFSVDRRANYLHKTADALRERRFELAAMMTLEAGKPWREADADVSEAIDYLHYYAFCATRITAQVHRRNLPGESNHLVYEPKGICVVLAPWSFPLALLTNMTAAALAAGNTVVIKPASATPVIAARLVNIFHELGLPPGVVNYLPGPGKTVGRYLVRHRDVNLVAFTGSREVGTEILKAVAETAPTQQHIKKVVAELGGKNAIIVDDDADLDEAVGGVIESAFSYSGQKCTACSRVIVLRDVYEAFCEKLIQAAGTLVIGPAEEPATVVAPLIDEEAAKRVRSYVRMGRREGRVILDCDPQDLPAGGHYVGPTIIADVDPTAVMAQEEIFGPVLVILKAQNFDQAVSIANGTRYALTGGVYSRSPAHVEQAKRDFLVGNFYINRKITGSRVGIEPFGGMKMSGDGAKAGGPQYLHWFWDTRTITEHTLRHGLVAAPEVQTTT